MQIYEIKLSDITPYKDNPRENDDAVGYVMESISQFGFKVPIIVDCNNIIVCGHTRYKAAQRLGLETVPCIKANDLDDEQIKAFRLADNKVAEYADWNFNLLNKELEELLDFDMEKFGFELFNDIVADDYNTDFKLPDSEKSELEQITFTLHHNQAELIRRAVDSITDVSETFGNTNKNGNAIYEVVKQWAAQKKL